MSLKTSLKKTLSLSFRESPFYKNKFKKVKLTIADFKNIKDLEKFPVTTREELLENNLKFLTCPMERIFKVFYSGGTTGYPKAIFLSKKDYYEIYCVSLLRFLSGLGLKRGKSVAGLIHHGLLPGGIAFAAKTTEMLGGLYIGAGINIDSERLAHILKTLKVKFIFAAPPLLSKYTELLENLKIDLKKEFWVEKIIIGGTAISPSSRKTLEKKWGAKIFMQYGTCEGGNIGSECKFRDGYHIYPSPLGDPLYIEVLDSKTFKPLSGDQEGIIAITTLKREAMPLIRYVGLKDYVKISTKKCKCGNHSPKIWFVGRESDTINLRGFHKLYLYQIDEALEKLRLGFDYKLIVKAKKNKDILILKLEIEKRKRTQQLKQKVLNELAKCSESLSRGILDGDIEFTSIKFVDVGSLPRTQSGKIEKRLLDERKVEYY